MISINQLRARLLQSRLLPRTRMHFGFTICQGIFNDIPQETQMARDSVKRVFISVENSRFNFVFVVPGGLVGSGAYDDTPAIGVGPDDQAEVWCILKPQVAFTHYGVHTPGCCVCRHLALLVGGGASPPSNFSVATSYYLEEPWAYATL